MAYTAIEKMRKTSDRGSRRFTKTADIPMI